MTTTKRNDAFAPTKDVGEAWRRCDPTRPLQGEPLKHWYVDCSKERGAEGFVDHLRDRIIVATDPSSSGDAIGRVLVSGHKGTGKSTELRRLEGKLSERGYFVVFVDLVRDVTADQLDAERVVTTILRQALEILKARRLPTADRALVAVHRLFARHVREETTAGEGEVKVSAEVGAGGRLAGLLSLMARGTGSVRRTTSGRTVLTWEYRSDVGELSEHLNSVLITASVAAQRRKSSPHGLVLIVDGFDRIESEDLQNEVFLDFGEFLAGLSVHKVLTVPISLVCSPRHRTICETFGVAQVDMLPSVQVETPDGLTRAREVILRRCHQSLFDGAALDMLCQMSGGDIRHLMTLAQEALAQAVTGHVTGKEATAAVEALSRSFAVWLGEPEFEELAKYDAKRSIPPVHEVGLPLLYASAILCYSNGEPWYRVHPAVRRLSTFECFRDAAGSR